MDAFRIALLAGIGLTVALLVREVLSWQGRRAGATSKQRVIRISSGVALILLLVLILIDATVGILFTADRHTMLENPALAFAYFSAYMGVACLLIFLALLDVREVIRIARQGRAEIQSRLQEKDGEL